MVIQNFSIESSFDGLESAVDELEKFCLDNNGSQDMVDKFMLLGSELITNGLEHGNKLDASKKVEITLRSTDKYFEISVKDEGEGFKLSDIPDPTLDENLLGTGGRGMFLIMEMADEYKLEDNGRKVTATCLR